MLGTFAGELEARHVSAGDDRLSAEVQGDVEVEDRVLVIRRIHIVYHLVAVAGQRETVMRVHRVHHQACPVYRSLCRGIEITSEVRFSGS